LLPTVDFSGNTLANAPAFTGHVSAEYSWAVPVGKLSLRGEGEYSSKFYFAPNNLPLLGQSSYFKSNAFLSLKSDRNWYATAFIRNIGNRTTKLSAVTNSIVVFNPVQGSLAPPRTYGLELGYRF
jgi:iron complex outermembrane recepter protein